MFVHLNRCNVNTCIGSCDGQHRYKTLLVVLELVTVILPHFSSCPAVYPDVSITLKYIQLESN